VKGSFTGASSDKLGFFRAADGGTLFLDEIAELSLEMQAKLLRVVQEQNVRPVGNEQELPVNVRILCASHRDLSRRVEEELFRQDLYFRLNVITIETPSLAQRPDDIPMLAEHFIQKYAKEWQMPAAKLAPETLTALCEYSFPGNVRELENILQRAFTMSENDDISIEDLDLPNHHQSQPDRVMESSTNMANGNLEAYIENIERLAINEALEATRWNKTAAAEKLGISFRALRYRCSKLNIE
jgi:two-component system response regulator PilR (NtrC family)